jgi:outer membrane biosynthesis protein TonB
MNPRRNPKTVLFVGVATLLATSLPLATPQTPQTEIRVKRIVGIDYPWFGRLAGAQGNVEVVATIASDGAVKEIRVVSGPEPLVRAVKPALSRWLFEGCGSATGTCEIKIVFSFVLEGVCDVSRRCQTDFEVDLPDRVRIKAKHARAILD